MMKQVTFVSALFLTACVTINIYFPAAAAEKVADQIIQEIQQDPDKKTKEPGIPQSQLSPLRISFYQGVERLIDIFISPAQAKADLSVNTAEIRKIRASMQGRFGALKPYYDKGYIGIKSDGMLTTKGSVPLKERNKVNKLITAENDDRNKLYRAIANANGHPEWLPQIKDTFATRWVGNAHSGWWYQTKNGAWKKK